MTPDGMPQVLVVGAGPVGLTMAHELVRHGLRVRIVDGNPGPATTSRAIATHPRTLETYDQMGVVCDILDSGRRIEGFTMFREGTRLARLDADYSTMPTRFPFTVAIDQVSTEAVLREAVARLGVKIEWGVRLEEFSQDKGGVQVTLRLPEGSQERLEVPWLVGCDGGHSTVRKQLGLQLIGDSSETWLIADAQMDVDLPRNSIYWVHTGGKTVMTVPMREPGRWRMLDTADVDQAADSEEVSRRFTRKFRAGLGRSVTVQPADWVSVFTFQQRMVQAMRVGRCFVAGDAAHVHSPASGQGMNTGVQEAFNLAWKLAMVEHGRAGDGLLESYSAERVPVGRALLGSTRRATFLVQLKNSLAGVALPLVFAVVRNVKQVRKKMQRKILGGVSGLNLHYAESPLTIVPSASPPSAEAQRGPVPGERVAKVSPERGATSGWGAFLGELRDPRWTLLVAAGDATAWSIAAGLAERHAAWLSVRTVGSTEEPDSRRADVGTPHPLPDPERTLGADLGLAAAGWMLIRPDGYLCARGKRLGEDSLKPAFAAAHILA
ncbi:FAD-dependent oxidoreductase [Streptomyces rimosus]|uniref:FAD-dependent oxidoreductase n=1 Tax=Streptomyces rimosus TaxID=1927 RepID=UPI001F2645FC|nr:FAD-dependent oxidoreductase [Streptomyces rimosus]